jgi:hypothetical protein
VFITAVPTIKLFAWGEGDSGGDVQRYFNTGCALCCVVFVFLLVWESNPKLRTPGCHGVFITVVPSIKLLAWGKGDSGGHVVRETTSRGLCGLLLVCPSSYYRDALWTLESGFSR